MSDPFPFYAKEIGFIGTTCHAGNTVVVWYDDIPLLYISTENVYFFNNGMNSDAYPVCTVVGVDDV